MREVGRETIMIFTSKQSNNAYVGWSGSVDPRLVSSGNTFKGCPENVFHEATVTEEQIIGEGVTHLKPPDPIIAADERVSDEFEDAKEDDEDMVAETPLHHH
ncbi:hypothetical protein L195_g028180 [Trifolium pratense]|uniref:Uncharacterized protein n=1 Tax=Trifolium pratense TaxID=57577 RepID=A0A2K3L174_TRIPR|nr:hypothetical protein L195_g028180 [Trifolium pratense]